MQVKRLHVLIFLFALRASKISFHLKPIFFNADLKLKTFYEARVLTYRNVSYHKQHKIYLIKTLIKSFPFIVIPKTNG